MPELPDVEGFRVEFARHGTGRAVRGVDVVDPGVLHGVTGRRLRENLRGCRFEQPRRHGKWLIAPVADGPIVALHFGMTGALCWTGADAGRHDHDRVVLVFDDGELRYRD